MNISDQEMIMRHDHLAINLRWQTIWPRRNDVAIETHY
jgi:hypothetical protein